MSVICSISWSAKAGSATSAIRKFSSPMVRAGCSKMPPPITALPTKAKSVFSYRAFACFPSSTFKAWGSGRGQL